MARIPTEEVERLKAEVSRERLVEAAGSRSKRPARTCSAAARSMMTGRRRWW